MSESKFILNNTKDNIKVISTIESNLKQCDEFIISVAFITESGITPLLQILKELEEKKIPGKILTTDYLFFSQPRALIRLNNLNYILLMKQILVFIQKDIFSKIKNTTTS